MTCAWTTDPHPPTAGGRIWTGSSSAAASTPAYHRVLQPHAVAIRSAVTDGLPYAGFSAGAMIAPRRALLGGWRLGSTAVTHEDNAEDLDQVTIVDGLGLVSPTVEVHTSQWGTLSRLVAAVAAGRDRSGIAVDENTVVILDPATDGDSPADGASARVAGVGQAWVLTEDDGAVRVVRREPGGPGRHREGRRAHRRPRVTPVDPVAVCARWGVGHTHQDFARTVTDTSARSSGTNRRSGHRRRRGVHPGGRTPRPQPMAASSSSGQAQGVSRPGVCATAAVKRAGASAQLTTFHQALT